MFVVLKQQETGICQTVPFAAARAATEPSPQKLLGATADRNLTDPTYFKKSSWETAFSCKTTEKMSKHPLWSLHMLWWSCAPLCAWMRCPWALCGCPLFQMWSLRSVCVNGWVKCGQHISCMCIPLGQLSWFTFRFYKLWAHCDNQGSLVVLIKLLNICLFPL